MSKDPGQDQEEPLVPVAATQEEDEAINASKGSSKRVKIIIAVVILIIAIVGAGIFFFFKVIKNSKKYEGSEPAVSASKTDIAIQNSFVNLEQMLITLAPSGSKPNYLKITMILQVTTEQEAQTVNAKTPLLVDTFQTFLRELRATDFSGSGSMIYLKAELLKRANKITAPIIIKEILFKELMVN